MEYDSNTKLHDQLSFGTAIIFHHGKIYRKIVFLLMFAGGNTRFKTMY